MPNHVTTNLRVQDMDKFRELAISHVKSEYVDEDVVDFEKLLPMPKELELSTDWYESNNSPMFENIQKEVDFQNETFNEYLSQFYTDEITGDNFVKAVYNNLIKNDILSARVKRVYRLEKIELGTEYIDKHVGDMYLPFERRIRGYFNLKRYGAKDWYDWHCKNWGTKWNSYDNYIDDKGATFHTAWATPMAWLEELAKHMDFKFSWADEDTGNNFGKGYAKDGQLYTHYFDNDNLTDSERQGIAWAIQGYEYEEERDMLLDCFDEEELPPALSEEEQQVIYNGLKEYI